MARSIHVLPIDETHDDSGECWCHPLPSLRVGDDQIFVHRYPSNLYIEPSPFVPLRVVRMGDIPNDSSEVD